MKAQSTVDNLLVLNGGSDCAAILHSFRTNNGDLRRTCASLDGVFAFAMCDSTNCYVGRDPIGVRPLFYGRQSDGALVFGSEVKSIEKLCEHVEYFPPGCCAQIPLSDVRRVLPLRIQQYYVLPSIVDRHVRAFEAEVRFFIFSPIKKFSKCYANYS